MINQIKTKRNSNIELLRIIAMLMIVFSHYASQAPWSFMGNNIKPYVIHDSLDIHDRADLLIAKEWIENHYVD